MDYYAYLGAISQHCDISNIDPNWLHQNFQNQQSPVLVAKAVQSGQAPTLQIVQVVPPQPSFLFTCQSCGCHDFVYEVAPTRPAFNHTGAIILLLATSPGFLCVPVVGITIVILMWVIAGVLLCFNQPKDPRNVMRCRNCGWTQL